MNDNLMQAVDAISASPAIRLRYLMLAAKGRHSAPIFPPAIEHLPKHQTLPPTDYAAHLAAHGHPLAPIVRLRQEAADQIERLIAFLDATEGDFEDVLDGDEDAAVDDAGCDEDFDKEPVLGFVENHPDLWDEGNGWWWAYHSEEGAQNISQGSDDDREDEHDGREPDEADQEPDCDSEPDADNEPSLGWPERMAQGICLGVGDDREVAAEPGSTEVSRARRRDQRCGSNVRTFNGQPAVLRVEAL